MTPQSENGSENGFVPRAPRFKVADPGVVSVTIARAQDSDQEPRPAELLDVSQHGMKLRVPVNLRFEEALQLKIEVAGTEIEYHGIASVRHIRADNDEHWVVGCAIAPPLSDETFSFLATTAGKERRRFRRLNIAAEATVRRQGQTEGVAAALHNLSSGGFCFSSSDKYEVGEPVKLTLDGNDGEVRQVEARICWQVCSPDGSIAGCQFSTSESYAELCACLTEQPVLASGTRAHAEPTSKLVLTAAVLAMFVPPMMTLMMQANKVSANAGLQTTAALAECNEESTAQEASDPPTADAANENLLPAAITDGQPVTQPSESSETAETAALEVDLSPTADLPRDEQASTREWVDNTGKYRTVAELIEVTAEHVVLLKPDGKESQVPWSRLSETDQEFARAWQNQLD